MTHHCERNSNYLEPQQGNIHHSHCPGCNQDIAKNQNMSGYHETNTFWYCQVPNFPQSLWHPFHPLFPRIVSSHPGQIYSQQSIPFAFYHLSKGMLSCTNTDQFLQSKPLNIDYLVSQKRLKKLLQFFLNIGHLFAIFFYLSMHSNFHSLNERKGSKHWNQ